jgi:uncharacterized protein YjiK
MPSHLPRGRPRTLRSRLLRLTGWLLLALATVGVWQLQLVPLAWQLAGLLWRQPPPGTPALNLSRYRVGIEARPIAGIADNTSGLTYHAGSGTLFAAINRPASVAEISTDGELLRLMPLEGVRDPEGIAHVQDDLFVVADERGNRVFAVRIGPKSERLVAQPVPGVELPASPLRNQGIEGISWDHAGQRLFVSQEIWPRKVWLVEGLDPGGAPSRPPPRIREWRPLGGGMVPIGDYSSVSLHEPTGELLVASKLTGMVLAYAPDGSLAGTLPLWPGFRGLARRVPQAEGMALDPAGTVYLVSEPNLFYRFEPGQP